MNVTGIKVSRFFFRYLGTSAANLLGMNSSEASTMRFRYVSLILALTGLFLHAAFADVVPPEQDFRHVERSVEGASRFDLIRSGKAEFSLVVSDPNDKILSTAAQDLARYMKSRWGSEPQIAAHAENGHGNVIVLASLKSVATLPSAFKTATAQDGDLGEQAFVIQRVVLSGNRVALLCLGGGSIGARYATIEILRRMSYDRREASVNLDRIRDEPYS